MTEQHGRRFEKDMNSERTIPGFVDLQVNGHLGIDFTSAELSEDSFIHACRSLHEAGTAAFLPTIITCPVERFERNLRLMARVMARDEFAAMLPGIHVEGPFISSVTGAVGAHDPAQVRAPDVDLLHQLIAWSGGRVKMITLAPELEGADSLTREAVAKGLVVAAGHTLAAPADLARFARAGGTVLTHLGNALPASLPKFDNPVWAGLAEDRLTATLITDGHHVPSHALRSIIRAKGVDRIAVVSDASPIAGLPPGNYRALGNEIVLEPSGRLHNPSKGCLVGSSATLLQCMNHLASLRFLTPAELVAVGFDQPLRIIGVPPHDIPASGRWHFDESRACFARA